VYCFCSSGPHQTSRNENDPSREPSHKLKIAHLITHLFGSIGGLQVCLHNVCNRHASQGIDSTVFCCDADRKNFSTSYTVQKFLTFSGITTFYGISKQFFSWYVSRIQKRHQFDIWQIYGGYPFGTLLADFFQTHHIPCVLRCSGDDIQIDNDLQYGVRRQAKIDRIISKNYRKFTAVVAISDSVQEEYLKLDIPESRINLIPNGVDGHRLLSPINIDIRRRHGIPENSVLLLSVGRMHPKKGYHLIPEILKGLTDSGLDAYWLVIGRGCNELMHQAGFQQYRSRIRLIEQIGASTSAEPELPSTELIAYYQSANVFVMTSLMETFGIVIVEAMAAGLPVVCFNVPGVRDIAQKECGVICPPGDVTAFIRGIRDMIRLTTDSQEISDNCRNYVKQYSWDHIASRYLDMYHQLLMGR